MLIGRRKIVYTDLFFNDTNIREMCKNNSSLFKGLLYEMISNKSFMNQKMSYINANGVRKLCTVSDYIK